MKLLQIDLIKLDTNLTLSEGGAVIVVSQNLRLHVS